MTAKTEPLGTRAIEHPRGTVHIFEMGYHLDARRLATRWYPTDMIHLLVFFDGPTKGNKGKAVRLYGPAAPFEASIAIRAT